MGLEGNGRGHGLDHRGLAMDDGVESVDGVGRVLDDAPRAVGLDERVAALDDVTVAGLVLGLGVAGQSVLDIVGVAVLGVGVVLADLGQDGHRCGHGYWMAECNWSRDDAGPGESEGGDERERRDEDL